jgi:hypothetical protein
MEGRIRFRQSREATASQPIKVATVNHHTTHSNTVATNPFGYLVHHYVSAMLDRLA